MVLRLFERCDQLQAQAGWGDVVQSLKGAIEDPSHIHILGIAAGVAIALWINYRVAKWLLSRGDSRSS